MNNLMSAPTVESAAGIGAEAVKTIRENMPEAVRRIAFARATDIVEVVRSVAPLRQEGNRFVGFCPFCEKLKHPTLIVTPNDQWFRCLGCGSGGDVIQFVRNYERKMIGRAIATREAGLAGRAVNN